MTYLDKSAVLSPCGLYRYSLTRRWSHGDKAALFVMLNPSTADADADDPTIRRCVGFAQREGCDAMTVVNCYAYRTPDPVLLWGRRNAGVDIVGPDNEHHVQGALFRIPLVIAAWGAHDVSRSPIPGRLVRTMCLGTAKNGSPRHPLYVRGDEPLVRWVAP